MGELPSLTSHSNRSLRTEVSVAGKRNFQGGDKATETQPRHRQIIISSAHLETATLFSAIFAAAFAGIAMFYAISFTERRLIFWSSADAE